MLRAASEFGADGAEAEDDVEAVAHVAQEKAVQVVCCVRYTCANRDKKNLCIVYSGQLYPDASEGQFLHVRGFSMNGTASVHYPCMQLGFTLEIDRERWL